MSTHTHEHRRTLTHTSVHFIHRFMCVCVYLNPFYVFGKEETKIYEKMTV